MNRRTFGTVCRNVLAGVGLETKLFAHTGEEVFPSVASHNNLFHFGYEYVLGTSLDLKVVALSRARAEDVAAAALAEIDRQARILSAWDRNSEFSNWLLTKNEPVSVSPELFEILDLFDRWRERTAGAIDASAETMVRVWQRAETENRLPSQAELSAGLASMGRKHWDLDAERKTATRSSVSMPTMRIPAWSQVSKIV
jgi:FAD:protein FMN transferase